MIGEDDATAAGRATDEFDCGLDRLCAAVREEASVGIVRHPSNQRLGQQAGEGLALHLDEVGKLELHGVAERLFDRRMATTEREHTETREEVEVSRAIAVEEVCAFGAHVVAIEAEGAQDLRHLRIHIALVQRERLTRLVVRATPSRRTRS